MLLLTNADVVEALTMEACLDAAEASTLRVARGRLVKWESSGRNVEVGAEDGYPVQYNLRLAPMVDLDDEIAILRILSYVGQQFERDGIVRQVNVPVDPSRFTANGAKTGPPTSSERSGWLHVFDLRSGRLLAIVQERDIQVLRVGAVGGLNTKWFARPNARTLGLIGAGWMARSQLLGNAAVRDLATVKVYSPRAESREAFADEFRARLGIEVIPVGTAEEAVRGSDIVVSATNTTRPTFDSALVEPGAHVHCVSGADYDAGMIERADVIVWTSPAAHARDAAGDGAAFDVKEAEAVKLSARARGTSRNYRAAGWALLSQYLDKRVYLSEVIDGTAVGRRDDRQITLSASPAAGSASMPRFAVLLPTLLRIARERGLGQELPDAWFIQESAEYPAYRLR
jgi:ornithine cyclodeaminase/alanine dehydrogenase-like protein (mu-crystallin family)